MDTGAFRSSRERRRSMRCKRLNGVLIVVVRSCGECFERSSGDGVGTSDGCGRQYTLDPCRPVDVPVELAHC